MKKTIIILVFLICSILYGDIILTTEDGRKVILRDDGSWIYEDEQNEGQFQILNHAFK